MVLFKIENKIESHYKFIEEEIELRIESIKIKIDESEEKVLKRIERFKENIISQKVKELNAFKGSEVKFECKIRLKQIGSCQYDQIRAKLDFESIRSNSILNINF